LRAGFAEIEITPPLGTGKIGWIIKIIPDEIVDPLYARAAILENAATKIAFIQLDTLGVDRETTSDLRQQLKDNYGFPGEQVMVCATHNHAGPAVCDSGDTVKDEAYVKTLVPKIVAMFGQALDNMQQAEIGLGGGFEFKVAHNRRIRLRNGTVKTHGTFQDPEALCYEGPIDPEVAVLALRGKDKTPLGLLVNYACHPTHHGEDNCFSAGFPGALVNQMKRRGWPITLYLQGAAGNVHFANPEDPEDTKDELQIGAILAKDVESVLAKMDFGEAVYLGVNGKTIQVPFRQITDEQIKGTAQGAQRFVDPSAYDRAMPELLEYIKQMGTAPVELQVFFIGNYAIASNPAEYFVQHGLSIKEETYPVHTLITAYTNGNLGYVPHQEAFTRGGYETTFGPMSKLAPEAGDIMADAMIALLKEGPHK